MEVMADRDVLADLPRHIQAAASHAARINIVLARRTKEKKYTPKGLKG